MEGRKGMMLMFFMGGRGTILSGHSSLAINYGTKAAADGCGHEEEEKWTTDKRQLTLFDPGWILASLCSWMDKSL